MDESKASPHKVKVVDRRKFTTDGDPRERDVAAPDQPTSRASQRASADEMAHCFYEVQWQPRSRLIQGVTGGSSPSNLVSPDQVTQLIEPEVQRIRQQVKPV